MIRASEPPMTRRRPSRMFVHTIDVMLISDSNRASAWLAWFF
jgi:hypothetical protein